MDKNFRIFIQFLARVLLTLATLSVIVVFLPLVVFGPFSFLGFILGHFVCFSILESTLLLISLPLLLGALTVWWRSEIVREKRIINEVGYARALWTDEDPTAASRVLLPVVVAGWDLVLPPFWAAILPWLKLVWPSAPEHTSTEEISSVTWVTFVELLASLTGGPNLLGVALCTGIFTGTWKLYGASLYMLKRSLRCFAIVLAVIWLMDGEHVISAIITIAELLSVLKSGVFFTWLKWRFTHAFVACTNLALDVTTVSRKYTPLAFKQFAGKSNERSFAGLVREKLMQATILVSDLGLPHYIRGTRAPTRENLRESLSILKDLGWPVNVELNDEIDVATVKLGFKEWLLCGTDWHQGIRNLKLHTDELLDQLRTNAVEFKRTEEYGTVENELLATSRYFKSPKYDYPDLELDDVWFMVKDTFEHSRLTPFNYIIGAWEKKYGLGSFFRRPNSKGKLSRRDFIKSIGGLKPFKQLWRKTFEYATVIVPVSAVSIKGEALPPRKWMNDKVRSIIGTPLVHYIMSTIWNYEPNHRFAWTTTPTKIGMPLNGYWLADLYHRHSRCQHHFAGDMSDFDSTISGKVVDIIKAVRKKGFESHRDIERISVLIDVAYDQLDSQLLNTTSTGQIYKKGTGLTTGHSSTSMDNSLALLTLYLLAWKELTGLGAREFKFFNELSDYGDDHILSFLGTKPAAWNFRNIQKVMARWGVTNRLEADGPLDKIPFLSKFSRKLTAEDRASFDKHNIPYPKRAVWHDRDRLLGKMVAKVKNHDPRYRAKRLLSYLSLTAHHEDIYNGIHRVLTRSSTMKRALKTMKVQVPTYQKVLADWYRPSQNSISDVFGEDSAEADVHGQVFHYGRVGWADTFLGVISLAPDVVNPALFNFGYDRLLQLQMREWLLWPVNFLVLQNGAMSRGELNQVIRKTVYRSLIPDVHDVTLEATDPSLYLLRHWAFIAYKVMTKDTKQSGWISGIAYKMTQWQFVLNGQVCQDFAIFNWEYLDLAVIAALNLIPLSSGLSFVSTLLLPRFDLLWNSISGWFLALFWSNVPANYKDVSVALRKLSPKSSPLLVTAGTGTGKSTAFIKHTVLTVGHLYNKIIVVQPRSLLVHSIVPYVRKTFSLDCTGRTTGSDFDPTRKVWFVTAQEVLLHLQQTVTSNNLVIVDESHIEEPAYQMLQSILSSSTEVNWLMLTATPSERNTAACKTEIPLTTANIWNVTAKTLEIPGKTLKEVMSQYSDICRDIVTNSWHRSKVLLFHPSKEGGKRLGDLLPRRVTFLNADITDVSGQVMISTSVSDAGVTLPSTDTVISLDFDIMGISTSGRPEYAKLSAQTLSQRQGRTGRTNNGNFILVRTPNLVLPEAASLWNDRNRSSRELLRSGIDLTSCGPAGNDMLINLISTELGISLPDPTNPVISTAVQNLKVLTKNEENWHLGRILQSGKVMEPDHAELLFDYNAAGVVSQSSMITSEEVGDATIGLSLALAKHMNGLSFDTALAAKHFLSLNSLTALSRPMRSFIPEEIAVEFGIDPEDPEYKFERRSNA
jgi:hypothetical protein